MNCAICNKKLKTYDKAFVYISIPPTGLVNAKMLFKTEGTIYCPSCIQILKGGENYEQST